MGTQASWHSNLERSGKWSQLSLYRVTTCCSGPGEDCFAVHCDRGCCWRPGQLSLVHKERGLYAPCTLRTRSPSAGIGASGSPAPAPASGLKPCPSCCTAQCRSHNGMREQKVRWACSTGHAAVGVDTMLPCWPLPHEALIVGLRGCKQPSDCLASWMEWALQRELIGSKRRPFACSRLP